MRWKRWILVSVFEAKIYMQSRFKAEMLENQIFHSHTINRHFSSDMSYFSQLKVTQCIVCIMEILNSASLYSYLSNFFLVFFSYHKIQMWGLNLGVGTFSIRRSNSLINQTRRNDFWHLKHISKLIYFMACNNLTFSHFFPRWSQSRKWLRTKKNIPLSVKFDSTAMKMSDKIMKRCVTTSFNKLL